MARGRRGRPASVRSRVSRVDADIEDPLARPSRTREHRSSGRRSSRLHVAASSGSGRSSSPSRRSARERSHRRSRSASRSPEPPTLAKEILKALEAKTEEVKVVKEQLNSLKRKTAEEEPEFKYKSNKKQFKFNTDVKDKFNQILERAGADDAIAKIANEGMSLLDNRNKLISIADRDGWDVVEYFEADPLRTGGGVCKVLSCQKIKACMGDGGELERALDDVFGIWVTVGSCCEKRIETKLCKSR